MNYGELGNEIHFDKKSQEYHIDASEMQFLLNNNDWKLDSPSNSNPNLQMILLIPPKRYTPLQLYDYEYRKALYNSYTIPRWGGVKIMNIEKEGNVNLSSNELLDSFEVFIEQIRLLLGIKNYEKQVFIFIKKGNYILDGR
jgi:GPI-anchor transamidase subunit S